MKTFKLSAEIISLAALAPAQQRDRMKSDKITPIEDSNGDVVYTSHRVTGYLNDDIIRAADWVGKMDRVDKTKKASFATIIGDRFHMDITNIEADQLARKLGVELDDLALVAEGAIANFDVEAYEINKGDFYVQRDGTKLPVQEANARHQNFTVALSLDIKQMLFNARAVAKATVNRVAPARATVRSAVNNGQPKVIITGATPPAEFVVPERKPKDTDERYARRLMDAVEAYKADNGVDPVLSPELQALMLTV